MSGLFRRLSSRRSAGPDGLEPPAQAEPGTADAPNTAPTEPGGRESLLTDPAAATPEASQPEPAPAVVHPLVEAPPEPPPLPVSDLPAGLDPDELAAAPPPSARRSRLRRRIGFLRAAREVLLRDLGGFIYEIHRTAGDIEHEAHRRLREIKLTRLTRLDGELHALELQLDDVRRHVVVREPGVGGECPHCGELFGTDAHYCSHCGMPLTESARKALAREAAARPEADDPVAGEALAGRDAAATGEPVADSRAGGDAAATGEPVAGDSTGGGDGAATREPATGAAVTRSDKAATGEPVSGDLAARGDEEPRGDAAATREPAVGDPIAGRDAAPGEPAGDEPAAGGDPMATDPPTQALPASPGEAVRNGRDESVLRPVERRT